MGGFLREMGERSIIKNRITVCVITFFIMTAFADAGILDDLKTRQAEIRTVSARFIQEKNTKLLVKPIMSYGRFLYKQPDMMRWEYSGGVNMQVIYNNGELWLYYPGLKQADKLSGIPPYSSLMDFDVSSLAADHTVSVKKDGDISLLSFTPKIKGPVRQIEMSFMGPSPFPGIIKLLDSNSEETVITFRDIVINPLIQDELFRFTPEKGVKVKERALK